MRPFAIPCINLLLACFSAAAASSGYDPRITFAPLTLPEPVSVYRSSNGAPGPSYWQNRADYLLRVQLDTTNKEIRGDEIITYTNNSPDRLSSVWIYLEQNIYKPDSRASRLGMERPRRLNAGPSGTSDGFLLDVVEVGAGKYSAKADYITSDTRMQIRLAKPIAPHGGTIQIHIRYRYRVPGEWGGRTSWGTSEKGDIYDIAQWYPRMCVYDDLHGWDTLPYVGSEFYLEYGNFDYYITAPASLLIVGSGELVNGSQVLSSQEITRLAQARQSDATVTIRSQEEALAAAAHPASGTKTWHFRMSNTRDVSWSASTVFIWDAARIRLPDGKTALAESAYPPESAGPDAWGESTQYVKDTVERFSKQWFPYPWPAAINVAGFSSGMEYPGIVFDGIRDKGKQLFWITAHEIGHDWFPMLVGSNERRNAFMDEGFNTFIDIQESAEYAGGKYGPKRDSEYSAGGEPADTILKVLDDPLAPPIMMPSDSFPYRLAHPVSYFKTAYGLVLLQQQILGPDRFDFAFRSYIRDWAYKHPSPSDFFREMNSQAGEDLGWFWRGWFLNNWKFDLGVRAVEGSRVSIENLGQLVLPAPVQATFADGSTLRIEIPVEAWSTKGNYTWNLPADKPVKSVVIDPDHVLPDDDRSNNSWTGVP